MRLTWKFPSATAYPAELGMSSESVRFGFMDRCAVRYFAAAAADPIRWKLRAEEKKVSLLPKKCLNLLNTFSGGVGGGGMC